MSVSKLNESLTKAGCYSEVFTTTANGNTELPVASGEQKMVDKVPVTYFKRLTKDHSHFSPALLRRLWKEAQNFDIIHIHAWWNTVSVLSCLVALLRKVPVVISPRGMLSPYSFTNRNNPYKRVIHQVLGRRLISRSHIHTTSAYESQGIKSLIQTKSLHELPNLVVFGEVPLYAKFNGHEKLRLIFLSRIEEKKGLDLLLDALPGLNVPYHLTIAGDGAPTYIARLKERVSRLQLETHITWLGFQSAKKFRLLSEHDLLILPSHDENFANVVIESLSVGTPVLVSKYVGLADYIDRKSFGWICDADQEEISTHINRLFNEEAKRMEIRQAAPNIIRQDFDEAALTKRYISMYQQIIDNG